MGWEQSPPTQTPGKEVLLKFPGQEKTDPTLLPACIPSVRQLHCYSYSLVFVTLAMGYLLQVSGQWEAASKINKKK